jgi:4-amino-4-deoxy-L-arabinose transferase-like glycosyltransferase
MTPRRALWAVIGIATALRLACAVSLGGYTNEAYYYMYARHLDWGYFDHPPMVALASAFGLKLFGGLSPVIGLRLGFIALFAGSSWLLAQITERGFGARAAVLATLALNGTIFFGLMVGTFAEPDGPLLFFWLLTIDRLWVALEAPARLTGWLWLGVALGGAMLSKYYAVLLPAGAGLYLFLRPAARRCLRLPGPYIAAFLALFVFSPVIYWNATHGWASFAFQGGRAGGFHGFRPSTVLEALVAQVLYLTPWIFAGLMGVAIRLARRGPRSWSEVETFLVCQAVPALGLFSGVSTFQRIMAHWPLIGYVSLLPMLGLAWAESLAARRAWIRRQLVLVAVFPVVLALLFVAQARTGLFQDSRGRLLGMISPKSDPTVDTIRWDQIARELDGRGLLNEPNTFLFTDYWRFSAELAMAVRRDVPITCYLRDARSFTFWSQPEEWVGRDGIFVQVADGMAEAEEYKPWFDRCESLGSFPVVRRGVPLQTVHLYRFVHQNGPYLSGYNGPGGVPRPRAASSAVRPQVAGRLSERKTVR